MDVSRKLRSFLKARTAEVEVFQELLEQFNKFEALEKDIKRVEKEKAGALRDLKQAQDQAEATSKSIAESLAAAKTEAEGIKAGAKRAEQNARKRAASADDAVAAAETKAGEIIKAAEEQAASIVAGNQGDISLLRSRC
jgi:CRISPR/Cas system CSM-associated protein Csm4 (group 5 of RAMP superfamily)